MANISHKQLLKITENKLKEKGYSTNIHKEIQGYPVDLIAMKNNKEIIIDIETKSNDILNNSIRNKRFSNDKREYWVIIPPQHRYAAELRKKAFNLNVKIIPQTNNYSNLFNKNAK